MKTTELRINDTVIFQQISYDFVPHARHFLPVKFFPKYYFKKTMLFQLPQNITGPMDNALD